jgi:uncharacterized protein (DUF2237 family)
MPHRHTLVARKVLASLDTELLSAGRARGEVLSWSAADIELREMLANGIDRRARVAALWDAATDTKLIVKLSSELRQIDTATMRLLKAINTDVPQDESLTIVKARRAANVRWQRERERNAGA